MAFNIIMYLLVVSLASSSCVDGYKILMIPASAQSHALPMLAIAEGLVTRGHNVTVLLASSFKFASKFSQQDAIAVERYDDDGVNYQAQYDELFADVMVKELPFNKIMSFVNTLMYKLCHQLTEKSELLLNKLDKVGLDLVVLDGNMMMKCIYLLPHRLRLPVVTYTDQLEPSLVRVPWLPSVVPSMLTSFTDRMNFIERLLNTAATVSMALLSPSGGFLSEETISKYQQYGSFDTLDELAKKSLLWLYPRDPVLDYPVPMMPNVVNVGGLSVKRSASELPVDLKSFVESSKRGSIVVSFGSMASRFPDEVARKFAEVFRQLKDVNVVWRWLRNEQDRLNFDVPTNVRIMDWLPQNDLLANSHVKLFITHCGNSGQYEALYNGVPMIGFPFFADQKYNAGRMVSKGFGIEMNIYSFTSEELLANVNKILEGTSFKDRIAKASEIYRSTPMSPVETASFWIEHVCKYGGDHLRSSGSADLPLYAYWMLDIEITLLLVLSVTIFLDVTCVRKLLKTVFYKKQHSEKKTK